MAMMAMVMATKVMALMAMATWLVGSLKRWAAAQTDGNNGNDGDGNEVDGNDGIGDGNGNGNGGNGNLVAGQPKEMGSCPD